MKNIHVLPTNKPSRLGYLTKKGKEVYKDLRVFDKLMPNILDSENQHIYITNDEKPKEGNWVNDGTNNPYKWTKNDVEDCLYNPGVANYKGCKKIILTTDQSLDGVQAISDEFLQWFVQNPSCEEVVIVEDKKLSSKNIYDAVEGDLVYSHHGYGGIINSLSNDIRVGIDNYIETAITSETGWETLDINNYKIYDKCYKIIIPKEEPKPHSFCETPEEKCTMNYCDENGCQNRKRELVEPKQKTLEEAAERIITDVGWVWENTESSARRVAEYCAKQQKERMYSEEDMTNYALYILHNNVITPKEWLKQFKNKGYEQ
jgi:hypothetical protein